MLTGATPKISGIVGNDWYDRASGKTVTSVSDDSTQLLGGTAGTGASPNRLLVSTVGDEMKRARRDHPKVVGLSMKDRSSILPSGHMADAAYWFANTSGGFVSSTYYMRSAPPWLTRWNAKRLADSPEWRVWSRLLPDEAVYRQYAGADEVKGEYDGVDTVFPHHVRDAPPSARDRSSEVELRTVERICSSGCYLRR